MKSARTAPALFSACLLAAALPAAAGPGAAPDDAAPDPAPVLDEAPAVAVRAGGDVRLRQEAFDDIPIKTADPAVTRGGRNDYIRLRGRAALGLDFGEIATFDVRVADEVRFQDVGPKSYEWPDELFLDRFELALKGLFDGRVDVNAGRQDVVLGSGRLFADGTAKDGSRSSFFDGVRVRVRAAEARTLDLFAFYGACENDFVLGHEHRDLTGLGPGWNGMDEATAGFFWTDRANADFGWDAYYVWLRDTAWRTKSGDRVPHEDVQTVGGRLLPRFSETFSAEIEGAFQWSGSEGYDRRAGFATGGLKAEAGGGTWISANALWLSGDDADTDRREDFNVLFGRYPWISELLLYGFDGDGVGTWHNISQFWLEAGRAWGEGPAAHRLKATVGPVFAPERDGAGGGHDRGWLATFFWSFPVWSERGLTGHLFLEVFEPGDYYVSDETAYFFRWQLNWAF